MDRQTLATLGFQGRIRQVLTLAWWVLNPLGEETAWTASLPPNLLEMSIVVGLHERFHCAPVGKLHNAVFHTKMLGQILTGDRGECTYETRFHAAGNALLFAGPHISRRRLST
jgi:hypothetical protein